LAFDPSLPREKLEECGLLIGRQLAMEAESWEEEYAEHPYTKLKFSGFGVDIVPCYRGESAENIISVPLIGLPSITCLSGSILYRIGERCTPPETINESRGSVRVRTPNRRVFRLSYRIAIILAFLKRCLRLLLHGNRV
jgi:hypothetical protein